MAPVRRADEALDDPQVVNNGMAVDVVDPEIGSIRQAGISFRLHGVPEHRLLSVPNRRVGQHTSAVLDDLSDLEQKARRVRPAKRAMAHALDGIRVLDMGNFLAGPFGPMLLGDLGAKVYKLESPEGDQMRNVTMPFNGCQRGKFDVCADLKTGRGAGDRASADQFVDVVHHNMRPGVAERLGVDYATAKRLNPSIVLLPYHHVGSRRTPSHLARLRPARAVVLRTRVRARGEGKPTGSWYRFGMCDQACACQSAIAVLMALYWRETTGEGQFVDTSIVNGGVYLNSDVWTGPDGPFVRPSPRFGADRDRTALSALPNGRRVDRPRRAHRCALAAADRRHTVSRQRQPIRDCRETSGERGRADRGARSRSSPAHRAMRGSRSSTQPACRWRSPTRMRGPDGSGTPN